MDIFDEWVDGLLAGEGLVAEFDSGMTISAYEPDRLGITIDEPGRLIDLVISGEELEYLHLFLEAIFVARNKIAEVEWDELLKDQPSE